MTPSATASLRYADGLGVEDSAQRIELLLHRLKLGAKGLIICDQCAKGWAGGKLGAELGRYLAQKRAWRAIVVINVAVQLRE